jgi:thiamine-phosphate pyrophosphorylase
MRLPDVVAVTDPTLSDDELTERTKQVLRSVPRSSVGIQVRDKVRAGRAVLRLAERLRAVCSAFGAPLYINDRIDVALASGADGVHLGRGSMDIADARRLLGPAAFVSMAAHDIEDVEHATAHGATASFVSPIFSTPGKGEPRGTPFLSEARARVPHARLYALGGVDVATAPSCVGAGADGVAVIRALWQARDPGRTASALVQAVRDRALAQKG